MIMKRRLNAFAAAPGLMQQWLDFGNAIHKSGLDDSLMELVKIRASQINGCAMCLHMHTADARKQGETEERLYLLNAWRESPLYTPRERAALAWTEALTLVVETCTPDGRLRRTPSALHRAGTGESHASTGWASGWVPMHNPTPTKVTTLFRPRRTLSRRVISGGE